MRRDEERTTANGKGSSQEMRAEQSERQGSRTAGEHISKIRGIGKKGGMRNNKRKKEQKRGGRGTGRVAGSDGGWGVLISSQLFIPVSLHRGEQERKREREREQGREGKRDAGRRGEGGREATATAASMHRCSLLNVSISPSLPPSTLPSAFDLPICAAV